MKRPEPSPEAPLDVPTMVAFVQSSGFVSSLLRPVYKLSEREWDFFPKRYLKARQVNNQWGRVAIEFTTDAWKPTIAVGFLYDERDHGVSFVDPDRGIDLLLRLETDPKNQKNIAPALSALRTKGRELSRAASSVLFLGDAGNGNDHSLIIVRSCLGEIIAGAKSQKEQLDAIYAKVKTWGEILFKDGVVENALKQSGLNSGI